MWLVGLVIEEEFCSVQKSFFSGQHPSKFKLIFKEFGNGVFGYMSDIFNRKNLFTEGVNLLNGIERDDSMQLSGINQIKKFLDENKSLAINIRVFSEYIDIYNGGIKICFQ